MFSSPKKRERLLLIAAGAMVLIAVPFLLSMLSTEIGKLQTQRKKLQDDIAKYEQESQNKAEIAAKLQKYIADSLPVKDDAASQYQNWLMQLAKDTGITGYRSDAGSASVQKNLYKKYTFTLHGTGSLEQIAEFLRRFHKAPYLHLIRSVTPRPAKNPPQLEVTIKIEAMTLLFSGASSAAAKDLPLPDSQALAATDAEKKILKIIKDRAIFSMYQPPQPPSPPVRTVEPPPRPRVEEFDASPYCYLIAILEAVDGKYQCWIFNRLEDKTYKLYEEEMFKLGEVRCFVKKIEFDKNLVQIEAAGGLYLIRVGKSFAEFE